MIYKRRNLQQLWECVCYKPGTNRDAKKPKTEKVTVVAWNEPDICRKVGDRLAKPPVSLGHVYQNKTGEYEIVRDTAGPTGEIVEPRVLRTANDHQVHFLLRG
jgi:hypothetical protein